MTTTNDIDAIRKLTDAATKGPWTPGDPNEVEARIEMYDLPIHSPSTDADNPDTPDQVALIRYYAAGFQYPHGEAKADAEFIAAARTLVPALCDEVEQLRAAHDSAVEAIAEAESDIDDRDSQISMLRHDLDFQTKAAWDNRSKIEQLNAELEKVRAQLTDANRANDGYKADERSLTAANTALADENLRLREQVYAHKPVIDAALTWAEMCEDGGLAPDDCRKSEDELHDAVESYRLMDMALTSARSEKAEVAS